MIIVLCNLFHVIKVNRIKLHENETVESRCFRYPQLGNILSHRFFWLNSLIYNKNRLLWTCQLQYFKILENIIEPLHPAQSTCRKDIRHNRSSRCYWNLGESYSIYFLASTELVNVKAHTNSNTPTYWIIL